MSKLAYPDYEQLQRALCAKWGVSFVAADPHLKVGIALHTLSEQPLNGLRHPVERETTGWYLWGGQGIPQDDPAFFVPLHVIHLIERCPLSLRFLGLPPGYRFLTDGPYVDIWYDANLLNIEAA